MGTTVSYVELHTPDLGKAQSFYGQLFGWKFRDAAIPGMQYATIDTGAKLGGGMTKTPDPKVPPMWLNYINVENLAKAASRARELGAKILKEPTEVPGQGSFVVLADPTGATFALWEEARKA
jgi:uncharacterized protein